MNVGIFPGYKDDNGDWRFGIMTLGDKGGHGRMIFGLEPEDDSEPDDGNGLTEDKLRKLLQQEFNLSVADIETAVKLAKGELTAPRNE